MNSINHDSNQPRQTSNLFITMPVKATIFNLVLVLQYNADVKLDSVMEIVST